MGNSFLKVMLNVDEKEEMSSNDLMSFKPWIQPYLKVCTLHEENQVAFELKSV